MQSDKGILMKALTLFLAGMLLIFPVYSQVNSSDVKSFDEHGNKEQMNGYKLSDFGDFVKEWHFVTARFREDTKELRYTYANDLAWKTLKAGKTDYPKGAIFAKIGILSQDDPKFPSSKEPTGAKRFQFMIRDAKKFSETDGWGYVLFNDKGRTFNGDPKQNAMACAACHAIVKDRGYVFSKLASLNISPLPSVAPTQDANEKLDASLLDFESISVSQLKKPLISFVPKNFKTMKRVKGRIANNVFDGTLNEIMPLLIREVVKAPSIAFALVDTTGRNFTLAYATDDKSDCPEGQMEIRVARTMNSFFPATRAQQMFVNFRRVCEAQIK